MSAVSLQSTVAPLRRGWCPGALRPMQARDGLLVRLRLTGGILPAAKARTIADLATTHGNGLFDLSARGNLQMRGIGEEALSALHEGLADLGLLDDDAAAESVRNVMASPLAGLHDGLDIRPLVAALEAMLTRDAAFHALPGKFGFLIDDGSFPSLAGIPADVRFDWIAEAACFAIGLGGTRETATRIGACAASDLVDRAGLAARGALAMFAHRPDARRMRALLNIFGAIAVTEACKGTLAPPLAPAAATRAPDIVGFHTFAGRPTLGLATPFGRLDSAMLIRAAACADATSHREMRLTPWRALLVPGALTHDGAMEGFIKDAADSRLAIAACAGRDGCARGTTATHADAASLAGLVRDRSGGIVLHVSGCEKGCARPARTRLTLVGRDGRYDLVRDGRPGDTPALQGLDLAAARRALLEDFA